MPTKTNSFGEHFFVEEQLCAKCNKKQHHLPADFLSFPANAHKVEMCKKWKEENPNAFRCTRLAAAVDSTAEE